MRYIGTHRLLPISAGSEQQTIAGSTASIVSADELNGRKPLDFCC
jgi:hypothetical protein